MAHGLSGTAPLGRLGTASSDHREPKSPAKAQKSSGSDAPNYANKESFGFLLTQPRLWTNGAAPPQFPAETGDDSDRGLTRVALVWHEGRQEDWLKFGKPVAERIIDRHCREESYAAGQVFGLVRWASNQYGTVRSSLDIVRAVEPGKTCTPVPQVQPGGDLLLAVRGWPKVAQVFRLIDQIEGAGIDPCEVAPDHWRHIHNRLAGREQPRDYSPARHHAWLLRRKLLP
ncbi:DUF2840 domain-containing protein [Novosphingobium jiangmenense]|uniref:DUF2840 domain-containing protein n=1 Tax=Novosphingobium jiangmenense TaxID=2791981 RepID=A0ABS0HHG4_9SPHN|nr:DUF2840 domain-containing protein [Novosphingobium jiangmenense]